MGEDTVRFLGWSNGNSVTCELSQSALSTFSEIPNPTVEELADTFRRNSQVIHDAASALFDEGLISRPLNSVDFENG